ncbi:Cytochrome c oxidase caa3-type, assembly factor CtaG-related [Candidatus Nanopelagicaceae bacterium]
MNLLSGNLTAVDPLVSALGTFNKSVSLFAAFSLVGVLLSLSFLLIEREGKLQENALRLRDIGRALAAVWLVTSAFQIILTLANILGTSLGSALDPTTLKSFVSQIDLGRFLAFQTFLAAIVFIALFFIRGALPATVLLGISILALVSPVFQSHSASSGSHSLAIGSLVIHVVALSLWVGGIFALVLLNDSDRKVALPRFSQLALWAAIAVVASGLINAWTRLNFASAWSTSYARIVIAKALLTVVLLIIGFRNRKSLAEGEKTGWSLLSRVIVVEALIMGAVVALGSWLSGTRPPTGKELPFSPALSIVGYPTPAAPNFTRLLTLYDPDALIIGILITLVALYIKGVVILKQRGDSWPVGRTVAFALGVSAMDFATSGGLGVYAKFSFEYHMIAHMVIGMVAPIGLVLGAPITLALRTLPQGRTPDERGIRGMLITFLHSRYSLLLTNPLTALALFDGSLFVLYFTNLFGNLMQSHVGHLFMNIHFLLAGFLFFHVIIGIDPNPRKIPHLVRIVILFAAMSIHAFFAIALLATTTLIDQGYYGSLKTPWLGDLLADQHAAGAIAWGMGEVPIILALIATFIQWMRDDSREAKRIDRNEARMAAMGEPDELAHYNNYLSQLQSRDKREGQS